MPPTIEARVVQLPDPSDSTVKILVADIRACPLCKGSHFDPMNLLEEKLRIGNWSYEYWLKCEASGHIILFRIDGESVRAALVDAPHDILRLERPSPK